LQLFYLGADYNPNNGYLGSMASPTHVNDIGNKHILILWSVIYATRWLQSAYSLNPCMS